MQRDELAAWLRLSLTPGVGNDATRRLLAAFGLPQAVFGQTAQALQHVVSAAQCQALCTVPARLPALLETTWHWLHTPSANGCSRALLTLGDAAYPAGWLAMADPPLLVYLLGAGRCGPDSSHAQADQAKHAMDLLSCSAARSIAIVGSRNPTPQGLLNARQFAQHFSAGGCTVVSGLALGIDGAAHEGALAGWAASVPGGGLATIAVVGTGLDQVYPRQHKALAQQIAQHGLLVSEYPLGTPPLASNFPKRNRLIAGLSLGTLVVEAALPSGSLITARLALEQGREVFAIPGSIHAPQSRGCHALIKQGAKLVESAQDVLEELLLPSGPRPRASPPSTSPPSTSLPPTSPPSVRLPTSRQSRPLEDAVLVALGFEPSGLDALLARTGLNAATLQVRLLELELEGQVARLAGGWFQRIGQA